jgi:hypothetical protein
MVTLKTIYKCDICGQEYKSEKEALDCEKVLSQCPRFDIGNMLRVLTGHGKGEIVEIEDVCYTKPSYMGDKFSHLVMYQVKFPNGDVRNLIEEIDCELV